MGVSNPGINIFGNMPPLSLVNTTGRVFWVSSTTAAPGGSVGTDSAGAQGDSPGSPFATMNYADSQCVANRGDVVVVMPNHTETVTAAAGLGLDTAGVTWVGLGNGEDRPTVNFTTVVGADMDVGAASVIMSNFLFTGGVDALTGPIDVNASDFQMLNCETRDVTGQATDFVVTDANADRMYLKNWVHRGASAAGADTAITIVGGDNITIENPWIDGDFAVACIENVTTAAVNLTLTGGPNCYLRTRNAADIIFTAVATTTGNVGPEINARLADNAANITEAFAGADMQFFNPIRIVNLDGESHIISNITASTD